MKKITFEDFMQESFMDLREIGGRAITKDNFEDLFENWLGTLDISEIMEYAEKFGEKIYKSIEKSNE